MLRKQAIKPLLFLPLLFAGAGAMAQTTFTSAPANLRLYPRDNQDSGTVVITGQTLTAGLDSVITEYYRNAVLWKRQAAKLNYSGGIAPFSVTGKIKAELAQYNIVFSTKAGATQTAVSTWNNVVSGDVYLLNGQSNTEAANYGGNALPTPSTWVRSFGNASQNSASVTGNLTWGIAVNNATQSNYSVGVWGYTLGAKIVQAQQVPVCIINGAVGGTTVAQHARNSTTPTDLNTIYGRLLYRVQQAGVAANVKALLWYQGESDHGNAPATYQSTFTGVYNGWMSDFPNISKVYIVQTHHGCNLNSTYTGDIREFQRVSPSVYSKAEVMTSNGLPGHDGCHYQTQGYDSLASRLYRLVARDFYSSADTVNIGAPNIAKAYYTSVAKTQIKLVFRNASTLQVTTAGSYNLKDYFYLSDNQTVTSMSISGNTVLLNLAGASASTTVTFMPNDYYNNTSTTYQGPYLVNNRQIGAFGFKNFPVMAANDATPDEVPQPSITYSAPVIGSTTSFTGAATPAPASWNWSFSPAVTYTGGSSSTSQNPQVIFPAAGTYLATLTTTNSLGSGTTTSTIVLTAPPVADFNTPTGFTDAAIGLSDASANSPTNWAWTFPAGVQFASGSNNNVANPLVYFPAAGTYNVTLTASNNAGTSTITKSVTVTERRPVTDFTVNTATPVAGAPVTISNGSTNGAVAYAWTVPANCSFSGGTSYTSQNIQLTFARPGTYDVTLSASNAYGVQTVKTRTITVQ